MARTLFAECIENDELLEKDSFGVPPLFAQAFAEKARLYREAMGLLILLNQAKHSKEYEPVLRDYERLILPPTPIPEGVEKLDLLKVAMRDIAALIDPDAKALNWSLHWLTDVGANDCNPVDLVLFSSYWVSLFSVMEKGISGFRPE